MEQLPKIARQRLAQQRAESDHPAADVLAAFVERSLAEDERERVLGHLARCAECRDVVALAMPEAEPALRDALPQERAWHEWWVFRVGGLAAALVVIMVAVLLVRPHPRKGEEASVAAKLQTSETSSPSAAGTSTNAAPGDERAKSVQGGDKFAASARQAAVPRSPEQQATKVDNAEDKSSQAANAQNALRPYAGLRGRASKDVLGAAQSANHAAITAPKPLSRTDSRVVGGATAAKVSPAQPLAPEAANRPLERDESVQKNEQQQAQQQQQQQAYDRLGSTESVEATTQPSPPVTDAEIARAKKSKATAVGSTGSAAKRPGVAGAPVNSTIRWTISPAGAVQCSTDNGAHWQDISIAEGKTFRTLAASGSEVWAGGSALYHSSDFGADWAPVNVGNKQQAMEGEITRIQLPSETRVEVTTSAGQNWTSGDGGRTWSLQ